MSRGLPQPHEGIRGTDIDHFLLSLDERAILHRECLIALARHLNSATLVGDPAPVVERMGNRMRRPVTGDLTVATEVLYGRGDPDYRLKGLGILLGRRLELSETDEEWAASKARYEMTDDDRGTETAYYLQYGPDAGDICRWTNSEPVALLLQIGSFAKDATAWRELTADGGERAVFTRDSLLAGLADSGFTLRLPGER